MNDSNIVDEAEAHVIEGRLFHRFFDVLDKPNTVTIIEKEWLEENLRTLPLDQQIYIQSRMEWMRKGMEIQEGFDRLDFTRQKLTEANLPSGREAIGHAAQGEVILGQAFRKKFASIKLLG